MGYQWETDNTYDGLPPKDVHTGRDALNVSRTGYDSGTHGDGAWGPYDHGGREMNRLMSTPRSSFTPGATP